MSHGYLSVRKGQVTLTPPLILAPEAKELEVKLETMSFTALTPSPLMSLQGWGSPCLRSGGIPQLTTII